MTSLKKTNDKEINIKVRSEVLEYSLTIEDAINSLLLVYLGIADKSCTKLFGNKAGISFKSKIDLLYDIDALSKNEHRNLELQMIFRNKFMHSLKCNSFLSVLNQLDNGIINKFKEHMLDPSNIVEENYCNETYKKIYNSNLNIILEKFELKRQSINDKASLINHLLEKEMRITELSFEFIDKLLENSENIIAESDGNKKTIEIANYISSKCAIQSEIFSKDKELIELNNKLNTLLEQEKLCGYLK